MNDLQKQKYSRLGQRLEELNDLNGKIGRLAFYLNETENIDLMKKQMEYMCAYKDKLEERIIKGIY